MMCTWTAPCPAAVAWLTLELFNTIMKELRNMYHVLAALSDEHNPEAACAAKGASSGRLSGCHVMRRSCEDMFGNGPVHESPTRINLPDSTHLM